MAFGHSITGIGRMRKNARESTQRDRQLERDLEKEKTQRDVKTQKLSNQGQMGVQGLRNKGALKTTKMGEKGATKRTGMQQKGATKRTGMQQKTSMTQYRDTKAAERKKNQQEQIKELMAGQTDVDGYVIPGTRMPYNKALKVWKFRQRAMEEMMGQGQSPAGDDLSQTGFGGMPRGSGTITTEDGKTVSIENDKTVKLSNQGANQGAMQQTGVGGNKSNVFKEGRRLDNDSNDAAYFMSLFDAGKTNAQTGSKKQKRLVGRDKNGNPIYQYGLPEKPRELNWSEIPGVKQTTDQIKKIHDLRSIN